MEYDQVEEESRKENEIRVNRATGSSSSIKEALSPELLEEAKREIDAKAPSPQKANEENVWIM